MYGMKTALANYSYRIILMVKIQKLCKKLTFFEKTCHMSNQIFFTSLTVNFQRKEDVFSSRRYNGSFFFLDKR